MNSGAEGTGKSNAEGGRICRCIFCCNAPASRFPCAYTEKFIEETVSKQIEEESVMKKKRGELAKVIDRNIQDFSKPIL
jgi:hypothetical protein